jgi:hypothetical protein
MTRRSLSTLLAALLLCLTAVSAAHAADTITLTTGADPTEEVPLPITVTWSTAEQDPRVMVTVKPVGPLGCALTHAVDNPNSADVISNSNGNSPAGSSTANWRADDPGSWLFCAYLESSAGDTPTLAVSAPVTVAVRGARATASIVVPARVDNGRPYPLSVPVTSELARRLYVTVKPTGGRPCEATYALDDPNSSDVISWEQVTGNQTITTTASAIATNGGYLLCAYVQEDSSDTVAEATAQATFQVGPDPCLTAKNKLKAATNAVHVAEKSVNRNRASYKRYRAAARRAHGKARRTKRLLANRAHSRYVSAVHRRSAGRAALAKAQAGVASACTA